MKIKEISIENIRGIKEEVVLKPDGNNLVIHGPNGTGKSAIVDAIDFLFTGDISRLTGRGTRGMSLKQHGSHIDADPKFASVKANIIVDGIKEPITIERKISKPKILIKPKEDSEILNGILKIAVKGQHVLSRSEILKYVAAESGKRAEEIQALLNLSKIEEIRKSFVTITRDADKTLNIDKNNLGKSVSDIEAKFNIEVFSEEKTLSIVNECRKTLEGKPLSKLNTEKLQEGISPLSKDDDKRADPVELKRIISEIDNLIKENSSLIYSSDNELRKLFKELNENDQLKRDLKNKRLLDLGISLIDESGSCPLCLTEWETGKLDDFLKNRLLSAKEAEKLEKDILTHSSQINTVITKLRSKVDILKEITDKVKKEEISKKLKEWSQRLNKWINHLKNIKEKYPTKDAVEVKTILSIKDRRSHFDDLLKIANSLEKLTPEQKAWDMLTTLKPMLNRYFDDKKKYDTSKQFAENTGLLSKTYIDTKDRILEELFNTVNKDFMTYYKKLHGEDEDEFYAELIPDDSVLDFKVDFYGRGTYHPRALHSEGHQDSMGLCLFLALNKKISEGKVKAVILDDVVMSIDSGHRRNACKLLNEAFPDIQFIITTHNKTWARQLRTDGVVKTKNLIEFKSWSVDTGPQYAEKVDVWNDIYNKVKHNKIAPAAHQLREHLEFFFENICASLLAPVRYKGDGRNDLGDFRNGAISAYKSYLKTAKRSAKRWDKEERIGKLMELDTQVNEINQRSQSEHWGVNENVHYSKWSDFSKEDFLPIVEAFQDFENLFKCSKCSGIISVNMVGVKPKSVKCSCGDIFWNLEIKGK